jgi:hexosaminidase
MSLDLVLLPAPRQITFTGGSLTLAPDQLIWLDGAVPQHTGRMVQHALRTAGMYWALTAARLDGLFIGASVRIDPAQMPHPQGYTLLIDPDGVTITGHDAAGAFYGAMTLLQIARQAEGFLPALHIEDWSDFPRRGVMLDISRDKVPTLDTLYALIDRLAAWKINELQLYTEHTFAYRQHEAVWGAASPLTGDDILLLDAYCRDRYVDLVPNQNSFGHMQRWLTHRDYHHLAEAPDGFAYPWGRKSAEPFSLCPTNPESVAFMDALYDELLPHFSSGQFNVGCDETWDIGQPGTRSESAVQERGEGRVYLDYLHQIHALVRDHDRTMQFWGDIIIKHPALIPELPQNAIALEWGYEADHPFDQHGAAFAGSGIPFYVCPGTSSWNAIAGRTDNALANLWNAAENGLKHGATGYLNTDWGDNGHWQPLPVSYVGFAYGAAVSWFGAGNRDLNLPRALDLHAFEDAAGVMGQLAVDLGNVYQLPDIPTVNSSPLFHLLLGADKPFSESWLTGVRADKLDATADAIDGIMDTLHSAQMTRLDADLIMDEFDLAADLLRHACKLGQARLAAPDQATSSIPAGRRARLAEELGALLGEYRRVWLARNRPGGLSDSIGRLERVLHLYQA